MGGALDPAGHGAESISVLWWLMFWLSLVPIAIVAAFLVRILWKRRRETGPPEPDLDPPERTDRRVIVLGGVVLPILLLVPVAIATVAVGEARQPPEGEAAPLEIEVTGHQFWWDLRYPGPGADRLDEGASFRSANELHVPVGRPVELKLESDDVIHSFWVPELDGKMDLVPGRTNRLTIQADRPGVFAGRCAELCGLGHTVMRILVVALEEEEFESWRQEEAEPVDPARVDAGFREEFGNSCAPCHTMRGVYDTPTFFGVKGPDLTHFDRRRTIGAGALPNTRESLARWTLDAPSVKPGSRMPSLELDGDELDQVLDYIGGGDR